MAFFAFSLALFVAGLAQLLLWPAVVRWRSRRSLARFLLRRSRFGADPLALVLRRLRR
jgi:hypothetical protein